MRLMPQAKLKKSRRGPKWTVKVYHIQEIIRTGSSKEAAVPIIRATYIQVIVGPPGEGDCVSFTVRPISGPKQLYFSF